MEVSLFSSMSSVDWVIKVAITALECLKDVQISEILMVFSSEVPAQSIHQVDIIDCFVQFFIFENMINSVNH